ncbi:MAG TPA: glycosyltransferase [Candidatus Barnesiella excrementigallinarum]|nr:glycosyltransferase [Candidatus Barnesiella excrementigallinarum]
MESPLFSIITITFNAAATLPATLKSVEQQSFADYEYLVVDGASTDGTVAIARASSAVTSVTSEPDRGLYDAMNKGLRRATGRYLIFLNAGDALHAPDTLQKIARSVEETHPDIVYGETALVDAQRTFIAMRRLQAPDVLSVKSFRMGMLVCHQAFVVRRAIAPEYDLHYRFSADYDWCIRCMQAAKTITNTHEILIDYLNEGVTTANRKASLRERYAIMCRYYGTLPTFLRHLWFAVRFTFARLTGRE